MASLVLEIVQPYAPATYFSLQKHPLPVFDGTEEQLKNRHVQTLQQLADEARGFFILTPEYHNGMSGALKNALDFLNKNHFHQNPAAIAAVSGGGKGGINALNNLRLVLRGLSTNVLPE